MRLPRYTDYNDTGLASLGVVPTHWQVKRLRFAAELNPSKSEVACLDRQTEVSFLPMDAIGDDGTVRLDETRTLAQVENGYTYFRDGDVVIAKITPCFENGKGAVIRGLLDGVGFGTTELIVVRPRDQQTTSDYLGWLFTSPTFRKEAEGAMYGAGGQKRVPDIFVRDYLDAIPPLDEQSAIATFLDRETGKIDALIVEQEKLLTLLAEKRQATISHAVARGLNPNTPMKDSGVPWLGEVPAHWDVVPIKHLSPVQRGASPRPIDDPKYFDEEGKYSWVRITDVSASDGYLESTPQKLSELGSSLSVKLKPGDLFVSIAGTVGKPCISRIQACIHDGFVYFPRLEVPPIYLYRIFEAGVCYAGLGKMGTQLNLNTDTIGSIRVALPPARELGEILAFLDQILAQLDSLRTEAECGIALLRERRSALIAAAVTGKIDVRKSA